MTITKKIIFYSVQSVTSVEPVGTASPLAFQNCRGRPLNLLGSKVMTDGTSQFFFAIFALAFSVHTAILAVTKRFSIIEKGVWRQER